jgi:cytochrome c-type biogenesis protein CcmH/NrfG
VLSLLQAAISLDSRNPLARFELAGVLMAQERLQEALQELQELAVSSCRR